MVSMDSLQARVAELTKEYLANLPERKDAFQKLSASLVKHATHDVVTDLHKAAHKLSGSAGTYGFFSLGDASQALEMACQDMLEGNPGDFSDEEARSITTLVFELIEEIKNTLSADS